MAYETILFSVADAVATVTLDRPDVRNGLDGTLRRELRAAVERAAREARVLVLTGAGTSFCSGQDLSEDIARDVERALKVAEQIDAGMVHVNSPTVQDEPQMPFGGVKDSGFGRFGGSAVVDEFTDLRWVTVQSGSHPFPF